MIYSDDREISKKLRFAGIKFNEGRRKKERKERSKKEKERRRKKDTKKKIYIIDRDRVAIHPTPSSLPSRKSSCLNAKECKVVTSVDARSNPFTRKEHYSNSFAQSHLTRLTFYKCK